MAVPGKEKSAARGGEEGVVWRAPPAWAAHVLAVAATLATLAVRQYIAVSFGERPLLILFIFPIILSAALGGLAPGITATLLAAACVKYFAIPELHSIYFLASHDLIQWLFLICGGILVSFLCGTLHGALRASKESWRMRTLTLNSIEDAALATDALGRIIWVNPAAVRLIGGGMAEILGHPLSEVFAALTGGDKDQAGACREYQVELPGVPGGELSVLSVRVSPIRDYQDRQTGALYLARDITAAKRAEEKILTLNAELEQRVAERTQRLQLALDSENSEVWTWEREDGVFRGQAQADRVFGGLLRADGSLPQEDFFAALDPGDREDVRAVFQDVFSGSLERFQKDFRLRRGQAYVWVVCSGKVTGRGEDGLPAQVLGIMRDITRRKTLEVELTGAKERAEEATRAKGDFLANMSHEIRTPMNAIIGMTGLALMTELSPKQLDYLHKIDASAKSLLGVINDILDFTKIEAGRLAMEAVEFRLEDILDNLAGMTSLAAGDKGLEVLFQVRPGVPSALVGDPLRLGQILVNLVGNAIKFTERGEILVKVELMGASGPRTILRFTVSDTGMGMSQDQLDKLFTPFTQADMSTTRLFGGTGLGLSICKRLVEMMGGDISVRSNPGEGTLISFTAAFTALAEAGPGFEESVGDLRGLRVLVADDSPAARDILKEALTSMTFEARRAISGTEALAMLEMAEAEGRPFDLILVDLHLKDVNGFEMAKRIAASPALARRPKVILVTPQHRKEGVRKADQDLIAAMLVKPVNQSALFNTVMDVFGRRVLLSSRTPREAPGEPGSFTFSRQSRVLLAEDNEYNQQVARELLESFGLAVDIANNGLEAVEMARRGDYDVILMDIQMPLMDGLEAAGKVREIPGRERIPILAMTAHAMSGDKEKSLAAGLNDHVTKPIDPGALFAALSKWLDNESVIAPQGLPGRGSEPATELPSDLPGIDLDQGAMRVAGNRKLFRRLLMQLREDFPQWAAQLRQALDSGKLREAMRVAHSIKGVAGNVGAVPIAGVAGNLEASLAAGQPEEARVHLSVLDSEIALLMTTLSRLGPNRPEPGAAGFVPGAASGGREGPKGELIDALQALTPFVRAQRPTRCATAMERVSSLSWPEDVRDDLALALESVRKYKFKDALTRLEEIIARLAGEG